MSLTEYESIFRQIGKAAKWITFSGGEPFLRPELADIALAACDHVRPNIINIPTNGLLVKKIISTVELLTREAPSTRFVINLSLDGIDDHHDRIRGVPGNYARFLEAYKGLRSMGSPNLTVGIHTVISKFNVREFPLLLKHVREELEPDSYISELAEERVELGTAGLNIAPPPEAYARIVAQLIADMDAFGADGVASIAQAFRRLYYQTALRTLIENRQIFPCYAGSASAHVAPDGVVWACCIRCQAMGRLRDTGYDLQRIWTSGRAMKVRESIRGGACCCPLANAAYTSMLCHPSSFVRVGAVYLKMQLKKLRKRKSR